MWVALLGASLCVAIMFVIRWYFALVTIVLVAILYMVVDILKPGIASLQTCGIHIPVHVQPLQCAQQLLIDYGRS